MTRVANILPRLIKVAIIVAALPMLFLPLATSAQRKSGSAASAEDAGPLFREYRGIQIGMTTEETRKKLGSPKDKGDDQDFYVFNDKETAQIVYDKLHKVSVLSVDFLSGAADVPTPKIVMGADIEPKADGSMYRMVRYTKAGYWVSYNRTGGDSPMISITIQKID